MGTGVVAGRVEMEARFLLLFLGFGEIKRERTSVHGCGGVARQKRRRRWFAWFYGSPAFRLRGGSRRVWLVMRCAVGEGHAFARYGVIWSEFVAKRRGGRARGRRQTRFKERRRAGRVAVEHVAQVAIRGLPKLRHLFKHFGALWGCRIWPHTISGVVRAESV